MNNKKIILAAALALLALLGGGGYYIWQQQQTINELTEGFQLEKEQLEDEYTQLAIQYEGYKLQVNNDSLEQKLEDQRIKMQRLVEELRQTKAQDAKRIAALKKELETVRNVLRYYVAQVDSLNKVNDALVAENKQIRTDMRSVQQQNQQVREQNETLTKKVTVAAQLSATNISVTALNHKDRVEKRLRASKLDKFQVNFTIAANVTAETGQKDIYLRILRPSDEVLTNNQSGRFKYETAMLDYSARKTIEFGGEETHVTMFYKRGESLDAGTYNVELYADGSMIGRGSITLRK